MERGVRPMTIKDEADESIDDIIIKLLPATGKTKNFGEHFENNLRKALLWLLVEKQQGWYIF